MSRNLYINTTKCKKVSRPPIWLMRQAGRYMSSYQDIRKNTPFKTCIYTPDLIKKITLLPINELQPDAAILFSDILVIIDALGLDLVYKEKQGPIVTNPIQTPKDVDNLSLRYKDKIFSPIMQGITACKKSLDPLNIPLIGFAGAPFTLATYLIEGKAVGNLQKTKTFYYHYPEAFQTLLDILSNNIIEYLNLQLEHHVDALQLFDTWAGLLPWEEMQKFSITPMKKIIQQLKNSRQVPITVFCKGSSLTASELCKTGANVIGIDWQGDLVTLRKELPKDIALQGNLDPLLLFAPQETIKAKVLSLLDTLKDQNGIILNVGHGLLPQTPYENVKFLIDLVKSYRY
ncbi:MAG: uroporphyrinogen decarboxylase [bacterium]